jgi:hypothetical protein
MTSGLELLHEIEKGSRIFTRPGTEGDIIVRPGWAYGLYRYRVPPEEEGEEDRGGSNVLPAGRREVENPHRKGKGGWLPSKANLQARRSMC